MLEQCEVYEVSTEVVPMEGADFPEGMIGGFVCAYVRATSIRDALDAAEEFLASRRYRVIDISHCLRIELDEYEPHDEDYPTADEIAGVLAGGEPLTGTYLCFPPDEAN